MNRTSPLADFLACEQVERVGLDRCRLMERPDGTTVVVVDDDGVIPKVIATDRREPSLLFRWM
jgi:hypothetical protein